MRKSRFIALSLPQELVKAIEKVARKDGITKSELACSALRRYLKERDLNISREMLVYLDDFFKRYKPTLKRLAKH